MAAKQLVFSEEARRHLPAKQSDRLISKFENVVKDNTPDNVQLYFTGDGKAVSEFNRYTNQNLTIGTLLIVLSIAIFVLLLFRSFYEVLIILLNIGISIVFSLGFYSILGLVFNVVGGGISVAIPATGTYSYSFAATGASHVFKWECFTMGVLNHWRIKNILLTKTIIG